MFQQIIFPLLLILLLPVWLRLLVRLRLGPALIYVVLGNTVLLPAPGFSVKLFIDAREAQADAIADGILFALIGAAALSWGVTFYRRIR